jgi:hypothetical protein
MLPTPWTMDVVKLSLKHPVEAVHIIHTGICDCMIVRKMHLVFNVVG